VITVRDGEGNIAATGPTVFLPQDQSFVSFGVVKARAAKPTAIGLEGLLYPTFELYQGDPVSVFPDTLNPLVSMLVYTGDLGLEGGEAQSVYVLDKADATQLTDKDGKPVRLDLSVGETVQLPDGLGSVTLERVDPWVRVQISQTPGKEVALLGVVLALIGLCGSLFIRPRRLWVRARTPSMGATVVEVAGLDRSGNGDLDDVLADLVAALQKE
jgi:cytochrome c biogenesis protein